MLNYFVKSYMNVLCGLRVKSDTGISYINQVFMDV